MDSVYTTSAARTADEREIVYHIRRTAFINSDADLKDISLRDGYDEGQNSLSHLLYQNGQPIGTIRASMFSSEFSWAPIPAMEDYGTELKQKFGRNSAIAQSSYFAIVPEGRTRSWHPKAMLLQAMATTIAEHGIEQIITIVRDRPTILRFYEKLGFNPIAPPRLHRPVNRVAVLLVASPQEILEWASQQIGLNC